MARIDADLRLGRHGAVTGELRRLVAEHPFRERFWEQLMLALYRDGRQGESLAAYQQARKTLSSEVGIDPGPRLQELHNQILNGDPALSITAAATTCPGPETRRRATCQARSRTSSGGQANWRRLTGSWTMRGALHGEPWRSAPWRGLPGSANRPDGALGASGRGALPRRPAARDLRGFDPSGVPITPGEAIRGFLDALGVAR